MCVLCRKYVLLVCKSLAFNTGLEQYEVKKALGQGAFGQVELNTAMSAIALVDTHAASVGSYIMTAGVPRHSETRPTDLRAQDGVSRLRSLMLPR